MPITNSLVEPMGVQYKKIQNQIHSKSVDMVSRILRQWKQSAKAQEKKIKFSCGLLNEMSIEAEVELAP